MGRRSMVAIRREEIVDAVQRCVVRYGLADTTMAKVAEEAGMQRSAISHFLGNRDDVIAATVERSCQYYVDLIRQIVAEAPPEKAADALVDELVGGKRAAPQAMVLFDEILTLAHHDRRAQAAIHDAYGVLDHELRKGLRARFPDARPKDVAMVARTLMLLIDNEERFRVLDMSPNKGRDIRQAARSLMAVLE